jgi:hypothetical protein
MLKIKYANLLIVKKISIMKKYFKLILLILLLGLYSCSDLEINKEDFASFESTDFSFGVPRDGESTNEIKVYTNSIFNSNRIFNISVVNEESDLDPDAYTLPSTVVITSGTNVGKLPITIKDLNIGEEKFLVLKLESNDGAFTGKNITLSIFRVCDKNELTIDLVFDDYPEETSWEILNASSNVVASSDAYDGEISASENLCLPDGDYTFVIYDFYEDGFCCDYGDGSYTLISNEAVIRTGGEFGASEQTLFSLPYIP